MIQKPPTLSLQRDNPCRLWAFRLLVLILQTISNLDYLKYQKAIFWQVQKQVSRGQGDHRAMFLLQLSIESFSVFSPLLAGPSIYPWLVFLSDHSNTLSSHPLAFSLCVSRLTWHFSVVQMKSYGVSVRLTDLNWTSSYGLRLDFQVRLCS